MAVYVFPPTIVIQCFNSKMSCLVHILVTIVGVMYNIKYQPIVESFCSALKYCCYRPQMVEHCLGGDVVKHTATQHTMKWCKKNQWKNEVAHLFCVPTEQLGCDLHKRWMK